MAGKSSNYNAKTFGTGASLMPEGVHEFMIEDACEWYKGKSPAWRLSLQPIDGQYRLKDDRPYMVWVPEDGVVEAIFDAAGADPALVEAGRDYQCDEFAHKKITAEVFHKDVDTDDGKTMTFANIRRLYPRFSMGGTPAAPQPKAQASSAMPNAKPDASELPPSMQGGAGCPF